MTIMLGNISFGEVEDKLGFKLTKEDKALWNQYHCELADLSEKESCFHVFDIPRCITVKGEEAKDALLKMFTPEKIVKAMGSFAVYEVPK